MGGNGFDVGTSDSFLKPFTKDALNQRKVFSLWKILEKL
jgi:hypothetical protein